MAKVRFLASEPHEVIGPINRLVQPDELVEVDNAVFKSYDWPESLWHVVASPAVRSASKEKE